MMQGVLKWGAGEVFVGIPTVQKGKTAAVVTEEPLTLTHTSHAAI